MTGWIFTVLALCFVQTLIGPKRCLCSSRWPWGRSDIDGQDGVFWARVVYVPAFVSGVPGVRSLVWTIGHAGLGMMVWALWTAGAP